MKHYKKSPLLEEGENTKVKSLYKALKILECFTFSTPELGITQISEMLGLNKSNVHSIISTFEQVGYLEKNEETSKYRLGLKTLEFSYVVNENLGYQRIVYGIMQELANELNGCIYFAVPKDMEVFYLFSSYPNTKSYDFPFRTIMGEKAPLYCTSLGKAMLASMEPAKIDEYMRSFPRIKYTDNTIVDEQQLREELQKVSSLGYSLDNIEHEYGVKCMGVPIRDRKNTLIGALSFSTSEASFDMGNLEEYERIMKNASFELRERF